MPPSKNLETFDNPRPGREYEIRFQTPEFTCLCPLTGQPDFAVVDIDYIPDKLCVELKSLKLYLWSYRDERAFHEEVTNRILDDLARVVMPLTMSVTLEFLIRGGIKSTVSATYMKDENEEDADLDLENLSFG